MVFQIQHESCLINLDAPFVGFNGNDLVRISVWPTLNTHTNDISLRFKTIKEDGLLFSTSNHFTDDYLKVSLDKGRGLLETNVGGQPQVSGQLILFY